LYKVFTSKQLIFSVILASIFYFYCPNALTFAQEILPEVETSQEEILEQEKEQQTISLAKVKRTGKYNVIDTNGNLLLKEDADNVWGFGKEILVIKQGKKYGFYTIYGDKISDAKYDSYKNYSKDGLIAVCEKKQWGFINTKGEQVIPPQFMDVYGFNEGLAPVKVGKQWGFIDTNGQFVIPAQYKNAKNFNDGLAPIVMEKRWGYIDTTGKQIIEDQYSEAQIFSEELAAVKSSGKWVYIDKTGKEKFTAPYKTVTPFYGGLAEVRVKVSKVSVLGIVFNVFSNVIGNMGNYTYRGIDYGIMEENEKRGYINKQGELAITTKNDFVDVYDGKVESLVLVVSKHKWGLVNTEGDFVIPAEYEELSYFKEGFAVIANDDKYNFVNIKNERLNKNDYTKAKDFHSGMAAVQFGDKWGYVKSDGQTAIRAKFDKSNNFYNEIATVQFNGKWRIIDKEGTTIKELADIDEIHNFVGGLAPVRKGKLWGYINVEGEFVVQPQFQDVNSFEEFKI